MAVTVLKPESIQLLREITDFDGNQIICNGIPTTLSHKNIIIIHEKNVRLLL